MDRPTPWPIRAWRTLRLAFHLAWIGLGTALLFPRIGRDQRCLLRQRWSRGILEILNIRPEPSRNDAPPGSLIVANHVSWVDIFAINACRPSAFVAKSEIRRWPFIGWLSARHDTVFLRRGSRGHARLVNEEIDALLNQGQDVAIFPEGMTTDGTQLLGFHAALLQPAIETQRPVLPVALSYHDAAGRISLAPSFAGSTTLRQCFCALLRCRSLTVRIVQAPAIDTVGKTRREVTGAAHAAIAERLFQPERISSGELAT